MTDLLAHLNPRQREAVLTTAGPVLVLAGPGSGKTRVLTHRVAYLIRELGVEPWRIMAVTFTNKAADVMRERTEALVGDERRTSGLVLGTFHRLCARFLRIEAVHIGLNPRYVILDAEDQLEVVKQALNDLNLDEKRFPPRALHAAISRAKNELMTPADFPIATYRDEIVARVYERYQQRLQAGSALDFDDLLMQAVLMLRQHEDILAAYRRRFEYILVDEFQDTNTAQYELVRLLAGGYRNVFVVGDEDQSIYRWRGADFRNVLRFREDFPDAKVILLEQNYRSTQTILDAANAVIKANRYRTPKKLFTDRGRGPAIVVYRAYDEHDEAEFVLGEIERLTASGEVRPGQCAIMYRTNAQSRTLEEAFVRRGMPYRLVGATRFYSRKEIKDVLAYLRLIQNPDDEISLRRIINVPPRRIGATTLNRLSQWARELGLSTYRALRVLAGAEEPPAAARDRQHPFTKASLAPLLDFYARWQEWIELRGAVSPGRLLDRVLESSGYRDWLRDGSEEGEERWQNVQELRNVAAAYEDMPTDMALPALLEEVALVSDVDDLKETAEAPVLLTLHAAKGMEFAVVFITGMEEGLLPHSNALEDPESLEEERRLAYVGITRAQDRLYLVYAFRRTAWGRSDLAQPSRFLIDIPPALTTDKPLPRSRAASPRPAMTIAGGLRFQPGQQVRHPQFGLGIVVTSRRLGDDEEVAVAFERVGIKRLLVSLARLEHV
jgi:DNA helicase-2/ATP-dependent DNA helicase PcrA